VHQGYCFASDTFTVYSMSAAGAISGPDEVCVNSSATLSVGPIPVATSYVWTASNGATGTSSTSSIELSFPNAGNVIVTVYGVNACGNSSISVKNVSVITSLPGVSKISGATMTCAEAIDQFSVTDNTDWTYNWAVEDNAGIITEPGNTPEITITWKNTGIIFIGPFENSTNVTKKVSVNVTESGCSSVLEWEVVIYRLPVTGPAYHIPNDHGL
jgi:hypothetical protein